MPIHDNAARLVVAEGALSLCRWLDQPTDDPQQICSDLPSETIYPDCVLDLGGQAALHIEFQAEGAPDMAVRMLEYSARLRRLRVLRGYSIRHQVVVLGTGYVDDHLHDEGLRFHYHVRYLREEDPNSLLTDPALAPFAVLADVPKPERQDVLLRAARLVRADGRPGLLQATRDLARIRLGWDTIDEVWKELAVPIPTSEQYRYQEGRADMVADALRDRFGDDQRIPIVAAALAANGNGWFKKVMAADSLDDLI